MSRTRSRSDEEQDSASWDIPPFWQQLNRFFLFPLQARPLFYAVVLALCSYLLTQGLLAAAMVSFGLLLAVSRYSFKAAAFASRGILDTADYSQYGSDDDWQVLPWKYFGVMVVHGVFITLLDSVNRGLGALGNLVSAFLIPVTLMVLISTGSLRAAINPTNLLGAIGGIGLPYFLLCLFLFLLMQGAPMALMMLLPIVPQALLLPAIAFVVIYFSWVMAVMVGYVMYQNHQEFGIEPDRAPATEGRAVPPDPQVAEARRRDAMVARLVQDGDMKAALDEAREWQRVSYDDLDDQRRYHRVLKLTDRVDDLTTHAQMYIPLLLQKQKGGDALEVWGSCYKRDKSFRLHGAENTFNMAQTAWKRNMVPHALALLHGFDLHFGTSELVPQAQELAVRVLKQGANKPDQALKLFARMQKHFPDHPCTQEAAWILRDELQAPPPAPAKPA